MKEMFDIPLPFLMMQMNKDNFDPESLFVNLLSGYDYCNDIPFPMFSDKQSKKSSKDKDDINYPKRDGHSVERGLKALGSAIRDYALVKASKKYAKKLAERQLEIIEEEEKEELEEELEIRRQQRIYDETVAKLVGLLKSRIDENELSASDDLINFIKNINTKVNLAPLLVLLPRYDNEREYLNILTHAFMEKFIDIPISKADLEKYISELNPVTISNFLKPSLSQQPFLMYLMMKVHS